MLRCRCLPGLRAAAAAMPPQPALPARRAPQMRMQLPAHARHVRALSVASRPHALPSASAAGPSSQPAGAARPDSESSAASADPACFDVRTAVRLLKALEHVPWYVPSLGDIVLHDSWLRRTPWDRPVDADDEQESDDQRQQEEDDNQSAVLEEQALRLHELLSESHLEDLEAPSLVAAPAKALFEPVTAVQGQAGAGAQADVADPAHIRLQLERCCYCLPPCLGLMRHSRIAGAVIRAHACLPTAPVSSPLLTAPPARLPWRSVLPSARARKSSRSQLQPQLPQPRR